ncbi:NTP transferase domain-containing protein [Rubellimicrobium rubrum]|uniref:NTP transferase domain-containing protein n=1 Tax=Rubellimicrobium rubrum TaxID=2585369 RepID=UPI00159BA0FA|nr:NTP transferase domain-containing protein [Rubellimicrobium rubrum]
MPEFETDPDWLLDATTDVLPVIAAQVAAGEPYALATIIAADGGPRPVGSQMVITSDRYWGFVSGGCVEADVAQHARHVLATGKPRRIVYGHGSPFFDIRLPCGGRIELLVEPLAPDDPAMLTLLSGARERRPMRYLSDGSTRRVQAADRPVAGDWPLRRLHEPGQRLVVIGSDPFALAMAAGGLHQGWEVTLVRPNGPRMAPPLPVRYLTDAPHIAIASLRPDAWTAIAVVTHDADLDQDALLAALGSSAGYIGVLGSRRRLEGRRMRLLEAGLTPTDLMRLRAPIGLPIAARTPQEIAVAVVAEIIDRRPWAGSGQSGPARADDRGCRSGARTGYHALLLAAGAGSRFGGRKLLADWCGEPLIRTSARLALSAPVETCFVVTGSDADLVGTALAGLEGPLQIVHAPDWAQGLSASLRCGLAASPVSSRGVVVFLGDMPLVPPGSAATLIDALESGAAGAEFLRDGAPAHPVAYSRTLFDDLRGLRGDMGGRHILARRSDVARFEIDDPGASFDIDCPKDLQAGAEAFLRGQAIS